MYVSHLKPFSKYLPVFVFFVVVVVFVSLLSFKVFFPLADLCSWCFVGIVRNIDPVNRLLYVLTPQTLDSLRQVNTLLKGNLEIPAAMLLSVSTGDRVFM